MSNSSFTIRHSSFFTGPSSRSRAPASASASTAAGWRRSPPGRRRGTGSPRRGRGTFSSPSDSDGRGGASPSPRRPPRPSCPSCRSPRGLPSPGGGSAPALPPRPCPAASLRYLPCRSLLALTALVQDGQYPRQILAHLPHPGRLLELAGDLLQAQGKELLGEVTL